MDLKRLMDMAGAGLGLILAAPLLLGIGLLVWLGLGAPILFVQPRPGKGGEIFQFYKFRTMTQTCDGDGNLLPDAQRLTRLGRFLRQTSLDELPQLWNVLRGEMSLVGPRPLLVEYLDCYTPEQARRHSMKPGMTGWAQVNGRNALAWEEKFALDLWYIDHWNLWLDLKILGLTVLKVLTSEGTSHPGQATVERFQGVLQSGRRQG